MNGQFIHQIANSSLKKMLILFDGVCNLCNGFVNFVIDRDSQNHFKFAPLQSPAGQKVLQDFNLQTTDFQTVILLKDDKVLKKSDAVLEIAKYLDGPLRFLQYTKIIPRFLRDLVYDFVAANRYRFFGKQDTCRIPTPELKAKFLTN
jgi:predicted DCC family thiol-disulfide oxidoreductase YuxK